MFLKCFHSLEICPQTQRGRLLTCLACVFFSSISALFTSPLLGEVEGTFLRRAACASKSAPDATAPLSEAILTVFQLCIDDQNICVRPQDGLRTFKKFVRDFASELERRRGFVKLSMSVEKVNVDPGELKGLIGKIKHLRR